jgi:hypothetical protein
VYLRILGDLLESYLLFFEYLKDNKGSRHEKKALLQKILKIGESQASQEKILFPESVSIQNLSNAFLFCENVKWIGVKSEGEKKWVEISTQPEDLDNYIDRIRSYLTLLQLPPKALLTLPGSPAFLRDSKPDSPLAAPLYGLKSPD